MLISMLPLLLLFEFSLILARLFGRPPEPESELAAREPAPQEPG
jgi:Sec-independent protein secretion pathway component TatC